MYICIQQHGLLRLAEHLHQPGSDKGELQPGDHNPTPFSGNRTAVVSQPFIWVSQQPGLTVAPFEIPGHNN